MLRKFLFAPTILMLLMLTAFCRSASPQGDQLIVAALGDSKALTGVPGVHLVIETLPKALEGEISIQDLQTDVELRLRQSGIPILTSDDDKRELDDAAAKKRLSNLGGKLDIYINAFKDSSGSYPFVVTAQFVEVVDVHRGNRTLLVTSVPVWDKRTYGVASSARLKALRDDIKDFTDAFCNDYLKANPKK
jgi:hypothetical protein